MKRQEFASELQKQMATDKKIFVLLGGVGYGLWKEKGNVINCEASEQAMVDMAVGLAMEGKIPFVYAITPHLYRAFEGIRNYLEHEGVPVKLVGIGRNKDYDTLGFTHYATDAKSVFKVFPNICSHFDEVDLTHILQSGKPEFINLPR